MSDKDFVRELIYKKAEVLFPSLEEYQGFLLSMCKDNTIPKLHKFRELALTSSKEKLKKEAICFKGIKICFKD